MLNALVRSLLAAAVVAAPYGALAQGPKPTTREHHEAMKRLDFMIGTWEGTGTMQGPPGHDNSFKITEKVESRVLGLVLVVEGLGRGKQFGTGEEGIVHNAIAMITYDADAKRYRIVAYTKDGRGADAELKPVDGAWQWSFRTPQATVRYTIRLTDKGEWHEIGESSADGTAWRKFLEMTLRKTG